MARYPDKMWSNTVPNWPLHARHAGTKRVTTQPLTKDPILAGDDDYCIHRTDQAIVSSPLSANSEDFACYDLGFGSDCDGSSSPRSLKNDKKEVTDLPLSGIARLSSRLPSLFSLQGPEASKLAHLSSFRPVPRLAPAFA